jgi:Ca2+-binding EF-hand superfamily protein
MERNMKVTILAAASLAAASGLVAANEPYFPRSQISFDRIDTDKDGKIEMVEFVPLVGRRLARLDSDGDKAVSAAEIESRMQDSLKKRRDRIMAFMDTNKDGKITESELDKLVEAMFNGADTDKDGGVSMAELKTFKRADWRKSYLQRFGGN